MQVPARKLRLVARRGQQQPVYRMIARYSGAQIVKCPRQAPAPADAAPAPAVALEEAAAAAEAVVDAVVDAAVAGDEAPAPAAAPEAPEAPAAPAGGGDVDGGGGDDGDGDDDAARAPADAAAAPAKLRDGLAARRRKGGASRETKSPRARRKDAQKALQFFSLAAQNGHVAALHRVGRMYARALGVARSCEVAVNAYKTVAERGPWIAGLAEAHAMYRRGDAAGARRAYARLAEAGYEVAQSNAAWLLEAAAAGAPAGGAEACDGLPAAACERRALALYERAAKQGHAAASLRLGDLYSAGRGAAGDLGGAARLARAVAHYQAAHELRHAQATFNLAWCYQRGLGVARDFHLAKRHSGQQKRAKFPTSKAHISAIFHSFRLIFGRAIISWNGLEAWMLFPGRSRAEHSR